MAGFILGFVNFWKAGGWKLFLAIGAAVGMFGFGWYVVDKLEKGAQAVARVEQLQNQASEDAARIREQNDIIQANVEDMRNNVASIGSLRRQLTELQSTITADDDATSFEESLEAIIHKQNDCIERISRGETNATCS